MGAATTEKLTEIEQTRKRIEQNLARLEDRIPPVALVAQRLMKVGFGGGVGGSIAWWILKRVRKRSKRNQQPSTTVQAVVQVIPDAWIERVADAWDDERNKQLLKGISAAYVVLRVVELRRLRALSRSLAGR